MYFSNPTFLIAWLVILRFILGFIFLTNLRNWIIYAVVLLFTGGMIVLFTYMASLVVSNKIKFPFSSKIIIFIIIFLLLFYYNLENSVTSYKNISGLYLEFSNLIILFIGIYLILILIRIVKIAASESGPIKSFFRNEK